MTRVVVIDDRVTNRNILSRLAMSVEADLQVASFADPCEALKSMLTGELPDLIVTDYNMPGMDGASFIERVRHSSALADVPVIVVTAYEDRDYCYRALEAGATDFLLSPLDHLEFRARARNLLTLRRQQQLLSKRAADLEQVLAVQGHGMRLAGRYDPSMLIELLPAAVSVTDEQGRLLLLNRAYEALFDVNRRQALGRRLDEVHREDHALHHKVLDEKILQRARAADTPVQEAWLEEAKGRRLVVSKQALADAAGSVNGVLTVSVDTGEVPPAEERGASADHLDPLTGVASFAIFRDRMEQEMARARRHHEMLALLHLDLDRFKGINDAFGSEFGDHILRAVAHRLSARLRETDTIARLTSDEFLILQTGLTRADDAAELSRRLSDSFGEPVVVGEREVHLSASTGITLFPTDGKTIETLLKNADLAVYRAKASGRDCYRFFAREMNLAARRAVTLERELRQALAGDQFTVHYQPQAHLASGRLIGMEALVRWNHPHRGLVRPGEFIRLAEDIGLIAPLTAWVLQTACAQHRRWRDRGLGELQLSVNLSPVQFRERGVELLIERVLGETGLEPASLDIELTENAVIENSRPASASLRYLHRLGVGLSIDDFGTGYSSLSYVKRLPVQRLKIDQSFVQALEHGANDEVIVRAIVNLGHSLGLRVIAEGVETEGQLEHLRRLGCDEVQGDLICPPLDAEAFAQRFASGTLLKALYG